MCKSAKKKAERLHGGGPAKGHDKIKRRLSSSNGPVRKRKDKTKFYENKDNFDLDSALIVDVNQSEEVA